MKFLDEKVELIDYSLHEYIPDSNSYQYLIFDAMKYSIFAGGKRLRSILMMGAYEAVGGNRIKDIMPFACAIEMIHTYSLIHDDLPAMDNDEYRRGKPTNHKVYGEAIAILAGDGLLNLAFETMIKSSLESITKNKHILGLKAMQIIANSAGIYGMIGGQVVDFQSEQKQIDKDTLNYIHENKTAAMIQAPLKAGAVLGNSSNEQIELLDKAGYKLGMAFQIQDDILDVIGDEKELGKSLNSDLKNKKSTFVSLYGLEQAKVYKQQYSDEAKEIFRQLTDKNNFLVKLTEYLVDRSK